MSTRLEGVVRRAVRAECADHKLTAGQRGLDAPTIAQLEKTFVTNTTFHKEIGALRGEMHTEFGALRAEMHTELGALRAEMQTGLGAVRSEMHTELGAVRSEMRTELGAVRLEIHTRVGTLGSGVYAELAALRTEMAKIPFETIKWFFTLSGIIAAICFGALRLT